MSKTGYITRRQIPESVTQPQSHDLLSGYTERKGPDGIGIAAKAQGIVGQRQLIARTFVEGPVLCLYGKAAA